MYKEENKCPRKLKLGKLNDIEEKMNPALPGSQHRKGSIMSLHHGVQQKEVAYHIVKRDFFQLGTLNF